MRLPVSLLTVSLLSAAVSAAFHSNSTACTRSYTVVDGDTCDRIGQKTLTSTYQILAFNLPSAGPNCYTLEIGAELCLGRYGNDCQFVRQCTNADTCQGIADNYGISVQRLQDNNPTLNCDIVYQGLMLCVSAGSIRPPADQSLSANELMTANEMARQAWLSTKAAKSKRDEEEAPSDPASASESVPNAPRHVSSRQNTAHQQRHRSVSTRSPLRSQPV